MARDIDVDIQFAEVGDDEIAEMIRLAAQDAEHAAVLRAAVETGDIKGVLEAAGAVCGAKRSPLRDSLNAAQHFADGVDALERAVRAGRDAEVVSAARRLFAPRPVADAA